MKRLKNANGTKNGNVSDFLNEMEKSKSKQAIFKGKMEKSERALFNAKLQQGKNGKVRKVKIFHFPLLSRFYVQPLPTPKKDRVNSGDLFHPCGYGLPIYFLNLCNYLNIKDLLCIFKKTALIQPQGGAIKRRLKCPA